MKLTTLFSILFVDVLFILLAIKFPVLYVTSVLFSNILNLAAHNIEKTRSHKMGYAMCNTEEGKVIKFLFFFSSFYPIINVVAATINYFKTFTEDEEKFLTYRINKFIPFKEAIKEYELVNNKEENKRIEFDEIKKKEYNLSKKMVGVDELVDEIMMNANLNNKEKEELLRELRTRVLFNRKLTSKKIKKLIK